MNVKDEVLTVLSKQSGWVSGEKLAEDIGVTRSAIWKAISKLKYEGYEISSSTNIGYKLENEPEYVSEAFIRKYLPNDLNVGFEIYDEINSTNLRAKELASSGGRNMIAIIANSQTAGRGRLGRSFYSPSGSGIYMSLLLKPSLSPTDAVMITTYTAVAAAKAIEELCGALVGIKWVNDLYMNGRKICGILTEAGFNFEMNTLDYAVVGIGINVSDGSFPPELSNIATSIENECGIKINKNQLIAKIVSALSKFEEKFADRSYLDEYRKRCILLDKPVTVYFGNECFEAIAMDIDDTGALIVETDGKRRKINAGEVSVRL